MSFDIAAAMQRALIETQAPSKRQVKNASGLAGRKAHNARKAQSAVGGFKSDVQAALADADTLMCKVVDDERGRKADGTPYRPNIARGYRPGACSYEEVIEKL